MVITEERLAKLDEAKERVARAARIALKAKAQPESMELPVGEDDTLGPWMPRESALWEVITELAAAAKILTAEVVARVGETPAPHWSQKPGTISPPGGIHPDPAVDTANRFLVSARGDSSVLVILNLAKAAEGLDADDAVNLAAWLVAMADPGRARFDAVFAAVVAT